MWMRVADAADVVHERPHGVQLGEHSLVLLRTPTGVKAYRSACPHAGGPLHQGKLVNGRLVCPKHGWSFDAETGKRGNYCLARYEAEERDGAIWVKPPTELAENAYPAGSYVRGGG